MTDTGNGGPGAGNPYARMFAQQEQARAAASSGQWPGGNPWRGWPGWGFPMPMAGGMPGAPGMGPWGPQAPPWWQGMAPQVPTAAEWPQPPSPNAEDPAGNPAGPVPPGTPVDWQAAGVARRPTLDEWRPTEETLTRWGVEQVIRWAPGSSAPEQIELIRLELALPSGVSCLVYARRITGNVGEVVPAVQMRVGIGAIQANGTPVVPLVVDGVARFLGPSDARDPAATSTLPAVMPAKWVSVNAVLTQGPATVDTQYAIGAMLAPISGW